MSEVDADYLAALGTAGEYHSDPIGLTNESATSRGDNIQIRQNNVIIILLIKLLRKINMLSPRPESNEKINQDLEKIMGELNKINVDKPKREYKPLKFGGTSNVKQ